MSYAKKAWANGDDVTPADFNRIEQGIADNANKINILINGETITATFANGWSSSSLNIKRRGKRIDFNIIITNESTSAQWSKICDLKDSKGNAINIPATYYLNTVANTNVIIYAASSGLYLSTSAVAGTYVVNGFAEVS